MKLFGRNIGRPYASEYEDEIERVLGAVTYVEERALCDIDNTVTVIREDYWAPFDSIFQETAWNNDYTEIIPELCKINEKAVFSD